MEIIQKILNLIQINFHEYFNIFLLILIAFFNNNKY